MTRAISRANRIATAIAAATLAALPLVAAEKVKPKQPATVSTAAAPAPVKDSPLVAAARRTKRLGKKPANVITNETLNKSGANAHMSAPDHPMTPLAVYQPATAEQESAAGKAADQRKAAEAAAKAKQREETRQRRMAAASEGDEQGYYDNPDHDEAKSESDAANARKPEPQKPPQF